MTPTMSKKYDLVRLLVSVAEKVFSYYTQNVYMYTSDVLKHTHLHEHTNRLILKKNSNHVSLFLYLSSSLGSM